MRVFRTVPRGHRWIAGVLIPCGWPLEEKKEGQWVLVDTLPPGEASAIQYVKNIGPGHSLASIEFYLPLYLR